MSEKTVWIVTKPSAYRAGHQCFLGSGETKASALEDAFGPKESWTSYTKRSIRDSDVYETSEEECRLIQESN
jgi:hypothetical protein